MKAKEKAECLISQFMGLKEFNSKFEETGWAGMNLLMAKQCAMIAVDEIIKAGSQEIVSYYFDDNYWNEVKKELEKL